MRRLPLLLSALLAVAAALTAQWTSKPWCDEIVITDAAVNFLRTGVWQSNVWPCCYNPLHLLTAAAAVVAFGASHLVVTAVGCALAFLASLVILRAMRRRDVFGGPLAETLFVLLFWSGWWFSGLIVNGRPDMMTLLALAWLLDELFPPEGVAWRKGRVVLRAALLMTSSTYAVPFCVLLSAFPILFRATRKDAFWRTFFLGVGFALGGLLVVAFYAWHREVIRFVGFLTFFNTITGECTQPLWVRLRDGYGHDPQALVMLAAAALAACLTPLRRSPRFWRWTSLVALVPAVMVFCGRFQPYYAWLFFVPVCILATAVAVRLHRLVYLALMLAAVVALARHPLLARASAQDRLARQSAASAFVTRHADLLPHGATVLVADDIVSDTALYYPLLARNVDLWFRGKATLEAPSDREKFEVGLSMFLSDPKIRNQILAHAFRFQKTIPVLPDRALVIFTSPQNRDEVQPLLERHGLRLDELASADGFTLCRTR